MSQTIATITAAALHLAGVAALATLIGVGAVTPDVGVPLLAGLIGVGAGAAVPAITGGSSTSKTTP